MTSEIQVIIPFSPPEEYLPTKDQVDSLQENFKQKPTRIPLSLDYRPEKTIVIKEQDNTAIIILGAGLLGLLGLFGLLAYLSRGR